MLGEAGSPASQVRGVEIVVIPLVQLTPGRL